MAPARADREAKSMGPVYVPSPDIVAREIEGEIVIVPLASGIGDLEDELYTLNETGRAIWKRLNGKKSVEVIVEELSSEFEGSREDIQTDVAGLLDELTKRKMVIKAN
jgi:hypothetical protein